jgi:predicted peroxiredoxin
MNLKKELVKVYNNILTAYFAKVYSAAEIKISDKSVGGKVEMINADGTLAPIPDGDYIMDDGFSFSVKDGLITAIIGQEEQPVEAGEDYKESGDTKMEEVTVEVEPVGEEETEPSDMEEMKKQIAELYKMFEELYSMLDGIKLQNAENLKAIGQFNSEVKTLNDNIQTLAKVPVEFSKVNKSVQTEETKEERLMEVAKLLSRIK